MDSPLAKLYPSKKNDEELYEIKRKAWLQDGILMVSLNQPDLTWVEREQIEQLGKEIYGKRN